MKHREKLRLARKLLTPTELKLRVPVFLSYAWGIRRDIIKKEVADRELTGKKKE